MSCLDIAPSNRASNKNNNSDSYFNDGRHSARAPPPGPWWIPLCDEAIRNRTAALKSFKLSPTVENYEKYTESVRSTRKTLRQAKRKGWRDFCEKLNHITSSAELWKMIKRFKHRRLVVDNSTSSRIIGKSLDSIQTAIQQICPSSCAFSPPLIPSTTNHRLSWLNSPFSLNETLIYLNNWRQEK